MTTEEFEINPDSPEMKELEQFLNTIEVEGTKDPHKFLVSYNRAKLTNRTLRKNLWLWFLWYWRLSEAKIEYEETQEAARKTSEYTS